MNSYIGNIVETGKKLLSKDYNYNKELMPAWLIINHEKRRISERINKERANKNQNIVRLIELQKEIEAIEEMTELETYEVALKNLQEHVIGKDRIIRKLEHKIEELKTRGSYVSKHETAN